MEFQNYINGKWTPGHGGKTFNTINPANGELLAQIAQADIADVEAAVQAASEAFKSWRLVPAPLRGEVLFKIGDLLKQKKEELARLFGASRTPVREALRKLESEGLVQHLPHRGAVVNQISIDDLAQIYPVRAVLVGLAARLAALHITEEELQTLQVFHQQLHNFIAKRAYKRATRTHTRFNMTLYSASRNPRLINILVQFNDYIEHTVDRALAMPGRADEIGREHAAILRAIAERNGDAADAAARVHVENAYRAVAGKPRLPV